jgi:hypothetical protein
MILRCIISWAIACGHCTPQRALTCGRCGLQLLNSAGLLVRPFLEAHCSLSCVAMALSWALRRDAAVAKFNAVKRAQTKARRAR